MSTSLERAIKHLGATLVSPDRYAFHGQVEPCFFVVSAAQLQRFADDYYGHDDDDDANYCNWFNDVHPVRMPKWWTPERMFAAVMSYDAAVRCPHTELERAQRCSALQTSNGPSHVVTADLTTGAEVPCGT